MLTDIEIAQKNKILKINEIANKINCNEDEIEPIGFYKGKFSSNFIDKLSEKKLGKLILVTALSPTPAGEGKTTTTVGLGDALNALNKKHNDLPSRTKFGTCFRHQRWSCWRRLFSSYSHGRY